MPTLDATIVAFARERRGLPVAPEHKAWLGQFAIDAWTQDPSLVEAGRAELARLNDQISIRGDMHCAMTRDKRDLLVRMFASHEAREGATKDE